MSDDDVISLRLDTLEEFRTEQLAVNKSLMDGINELKGLIITANAKACVKPGHCLMLDVDLQNHKLSQHERFTRLEEKLRDAEVWRKEVEDKLDELKGLFNRGVGVISFIVVLTPLTVWLLQHFFSSPK